VSSGGIDSGYASGTFLGVRFSVRGAIINLVLAVFSAVLVILLMGVGDFSLSVDEVLAALGGGGHDFNRLVVLEWRLPVALSALVFGALLGLGGAIFQSLTRNPLGSPDIIGFDSGAYTAVLVTMLLFKVRDYWSIAGVSILGGLITAALVYVLAFRRGIQGFRLIIVGIALSSMLGSLDSYLITRADIQDAMTVGFWGAGSLSRSTWSNIVPATILAALVCLAAAMLSPSMRQQELGDDAAVAHGVRITRDRLLLIVLGVASTAIVTAAAGPIGFIALAAPQIAQRLARAPGITLTTSIFTGAALLSLAHAVSVLLGAMFRPIPAGLVTVCLGGCYFIYLLIKETRRRL
jgi:iron-siderophore ABC transporter, inner membrane subunit